MNDRDSLLGILQTIIRWKKTIRNVCLLTLAGSVVGALLLDNYYKATTVFYPAGTQLSSPEMMFGNTGLVTDYFGGDRDLDRVAEIASSGELVDFMVKKFNLYEHYGLDSTKAKGQDKVRKIFAGLYSANKNKNDAVVITMEDTDPQRAAEMANAAREKVNEIAQRLTKESQRKLLNAFESNMKNKRTELAMVGDSLRRLQLKYGIYDTEASAEWFSENVSNTEASITKYRATLEILENNSLVPLDTIEYIKANLRAAERQRQRLLAQTGDDDLSLKNFTEGLPQVYILKDLHFQARKQLSFDTERYFQIKSAYETDIPAIHVVEVAQTPRVKSRPKRSLIVIGAVVAAFLFTLLGALIADAYRDVDWKNLRREAEAEA